MEQIVSIPCTWTPVQHADQHAWGYALQITSTPDVCMEILVDKLKLLDYEKDFCRKK